MDEVLQKTIEYLETLSPGVWRIAQQQVDVMIWRSLVGVKLLGGLSVILFIPFVLSVRYIIKVEEHAGVVLLGVISGVVMFFAVPLAIKNYIDYVSMQMNPEFYAIEILLKAIGE